MPFSHLIYREAVVLACPCLGQPRQWREVDVLAGDHVGAGRGGQHIFSLP